MNLGFPAPDHDHAHCVADLLKRAEQACGERGLRLTPLRRRVLEALGGSHSPVGAYEIVERLSKNGEAVPPMSVYRALDFLVTERLVHRIESKNAYLACNHGHDGSEVVMFLLCERCGTVAEVASRALGRDLGEAARSVGFDTRTPVLEISGLCENCRKAKPRR
jgi:Fur family zinc uptake transcriptional regulator